MVFGDTGQWMINLTVSRQRTPLRGQHTVVVRSIEFSGGISEAAMDLQKRPNEKTGFRPDDLSLAFVAVQRRDDAE